MRRRCLRRARKRFQVRGSGPVLEVPAAAGAVSTAGAEELDRLWSGCRILWQTCVHGNARLGCMCDGFGRRCRLDVLKAEVHGLRLDILAADCARGRTGSIV
jgi:hypothetical protein